jgi:hypothetical protein
MRLLSRRLNHWLHHHGAIINGLRVLWILCVFWFEVGVFRWSLSDCHWPDHKWTNVRPTIPLTYFLYKTVLEYKSN